MKLVTLSVFLAVTAATGCGKSSTSSQAPVATPVGGDAEGVTTLTLGQPTAFGGSSSSSESDLVAPYKNELSKVFAFSLTATTQLKADVTDVVWADGCGQVDGPWIAFGPGDGMDMTVVPAGTDLFGAPLTAGDYKVLVDFDTVNGCTLSSAKLTVSVVSATGAPSGPKLPQPSPTPQVSPQPSPKASPTPQALPGPTSGTLALDQTLTLALGGSLAATAGDLGYLESTRLAFVATQASQVKFETLTLTDDGHCGTTGGVAVSVSPAGGTVSQTPKPGDLVNLAAAGSYQWTIARTSQHQCLVTATIKVSTFVPPQPYTYLNFLSSAGDYWSPMDTSGCQQNVRIHGAVVELYNSHGTSCNGSVIPSVFYRCNEFQDLCELCDTANVACATTDASSTLKVCANGDIMLDSDDRLYLGGVSLSNRETQACEIMQPPPALPLPRQQVDQYLLLSAPNLWRATTYTEASEGDSYISYMIEDRFAPDRSQNEKIYSYSGVYPTGQQLLTDDVDYQVSTDNIALSIVRTVTKITISTSHPTLKVGDQQTCTYKKYYYDVDHYELHCTAAQIDGDFTESY